MAAYSGFPEERFDEVFIILDKMDKIGLEGVTEELTESGFTAESAKKYTALFTGLKEAAASAGENAAAAAQAEAELAFLEQTLQGVIEPDVIPNLREIMPVTTERR